jgi:hypothetical protein
VAFVGLLLMMNVSAFSLTEQILVVLCVLYGSVSAGLVLENNPLAIYLEWLKYSLILFTLVVYTLPVWIEWTLGVSILINSALLLFKKTDIITTTVPMRKANN